MFKLVMWYIIFDVCDSDIGNCSDCNVDIAFNDNITIVSHEIAIFLKVFLDEVVMVKMVIFIVETVYFAFYKINDVNGDIRRWL